MARRRHNLSPISLAPVPIRWSPATQSRPIRVGSPRTSFRAFVTRTKVPAHIRAVDLASAAWRGLKPLGRRPNARRRGDAGGRCRVPGDSGPSTRVQPGCWGFHGPNVDVARHPPSSPGTGVAASKRCPGVPSAGASSCPIQGMDNTTAGHSLSSNSPARARARPIRERRPAAANTTPDVRRGAARRAVPPFRAWPINALAPILVWTLPGRRPTQSLGRGARRSLPVDSAGALGLGRRNAGY
jgi:hypothetical protein